MYLLSALMMLVPANDTVAWPGFLGAGASDVDPASLPTTWAADQNIAWNVDIPGHGQSSPVIFGEHVFVTSCEGPNKETLHVVCLALEDGAIVWDKSLTSTNPEKNSYYISRSAPTPVVDAQHVFAYFESGDVVSLTHAGEVAWSRSLTKDYGKPLNRFGLSASPVQLEDRIIILVDDEKSQDRRRGAQPAEDTEGAGATSYILALNKADGEPLWKQDRTNRASWSSPTIVPVGDRRVVVCSSAGSVDGYAPDTGEQLFSYEEVGGNTAATPIATGDGQFLVAASPGRGDQGERADLAKRSNGLMQISNDGETWSAEFVWKNSKASPSFGSPIVHKGFAYWVNRAGAVFCVDAESGELQYTSRLQAAWSTPIGIGDRIYFFSQKKGVTQVLATGPEFKLLATNNLWDEEPEDNSLSFGEGESGGRASSRFSGQTTYGAAAVTGSLIIRTGNKVYCIRG